MRLRATTFLANGVTRHKPVSDSTGRLANIVGIYCDVVGTIELGHTWVDVRILEAGLAQICCVQLLL